MKKFMKQVLPFILATLFSIPAYAQTMPAMEQVTITPTLRTIQDTEDVSEVSGVMPLGLLLSMCGVRITDEGDGILGVYAYTECHEVVERIKMKLYIDMWNDDANDWSTIKWYDYDWYVEDYPDLHYANVQFDVTGLPTGYEYRLRGSHFAWQIGTSIYEGMSTYTEFIPLD